MKWNTLLIIITKYYLGLSLATKLRVYERRSR